MAGPVTPPVRNHSSSIKVGSNPLSLLAVDEEVTVGFPSNTLFYCDGVEVVVTNGTTVKSGTTTTVDIRLTDETGTVLDDLTVTRADVKSRAIFNTAIEEGVESIKAVVTTANTEAVCDAAYRL